MSFVGTIEGLKLQMDFLRHQHSKPQTDFDRREIEEEKICVNYSRYAVVAI
jgi:hypothetical protein